MTNRGEKNWLYALLALLASFCLWIYIVTVINPEDTQTITNVPVTFSGRDVLYQDYGLVLTEGTDTTVTVTVRGKRSDVKRLTKDNVVATVDVNRIRVAKDYTMPFSIDYTIDLSSPVTEERSRTTVSFSVEKLVTKQVEVKAALEGSIAEGYLAQDWQFDYDSVQVEGPESVMSRIGYAQVILSRTDLNKTVTESLPFTLIGLEGEVIDDPLLEYETDRIEVTLPIVQYREIPLTVKFLDGGGATADNVTYTCEPETVTVSGDAAALEGINQISLGVIDLSTLEGDKKFDFPIVLENNLKNVSGEEDATVAVSLHGLATKTAYISSFTFENVPEGFEAVSKTAVLIVTIRGPEAVLKRLSSIDLYAVADLSGYTNSGTYTVSATVAADKSDEFGVIGAYSISCTLTESDDAPRTPSEPIHTAPQPNTAE